MFHSDLRSSSQTGMCSVVLFNIFRMISWLWQGDQQEIESTNNILQSVVSRAPRISLPLLDARAAIRKFLGIKYKGGRRASKWSDVGSIVNSAIEDACAHHTQSNIVLSVKDRWSRPKPAPAIPLPALRSMQFRVETGPG